MSTPMMQQYRRIKADHRDAILFYRLGDFYEMFDEDAEVASRLLGLTLTQRQGVPMCGVPHHASHAYVGRLLRAGRKVAICEQTSIPKRGIAEREVVEVLSPATVFDEDYLDPDANSYLLAIHIDEIRSTYAWTDASTGELSVASDAPTSDAVARHLARIAPREVLVQESLRHDRPTCFDAIPERAVVNTFPEWAFDRALGLERVTGHFGTTTLAAFEVSDDDPVLAPLAVLFAYLSDNARHAPVHVDTIRRAAAEDFVILDDATGRNLELHRNIRDNGTAYTLFSVMNRSCTAMGARTIRRWISWPLRDAEAIYLRQNRVVRLYRDQTALYEVRSLLKRCFDLERLIGRLGVEKAHPKDLVAIASTVEIGAAILSSQTDTLPDPDALSRLDGIRRLIEAALVEEPPTLLTDGGIIRDGYDKNLDSLRAMSTRSSTILDAYLAEQRESTGISSLKVRHNRILGYVFEVPAAQAEKLPESFVRRQSLANVERFSTERLAELETAIVNAEEESVERERELFVAVRQRCVEAIPDLSLLAHYLADIDALQSLSWIATEYGYVQPEIVEDTVIEIEAGRHPVVEANLPAGEFVANDLSLGTESSPRFALVTGPNMAGKSTVLRQTALIVLMAHMGSFVPASEARIGLTDRIFCRVGASDNIARGESTFLVEMIETANILRNATAASVVIMDEVGRGTGTRDGVAIARATIEYLLANVEARCLFATHYHELTTLDAEGMINLSMAVDHAPDIVFLKRLVPGASDRSYGVDVARLAGVPPAVVERAQRLLEEIERSAGLPSARGGSGHHEPELPQGELFSPPDIVTAEIRAISPDSLSLREALDLLYRWKELL